MIEPKKKRRKNPVTALSNGLEEDLQRQGYGVGTIWKQRRLLNDLLIWLEGQQLAMADLTVAKVDRFMADRRAAGVRHAGQPDAGAAAVFGDDRLQRHYRPSATGCQRSDGGRHSARYGHARRDGGGGI